MEHLLVVAAFIVSLTTIAEGQQWSACDKSCGGGRRTRTVCLWGNVCGTSYEPCNTHECVSGWGVWQPCSRTCNGGTRFKVDKCSTSSFITCPKTWGDCNTQACAPLSSCPVGYNFRYKDATSCCKHSTESCGSESSSVRRIIGGIESKQGQWPWAAVLVDKARGVTHCGGSLIHKSWVVTAGHCFSPVYDVYILLGSVTISPPVAGSQRIEVKNHYMHPDYNDANLHNDIALVELKTDAVITANIKPVCLPNNEIVPRDKTCVALGWGLTKWFSPIPSNRLVHVSLRVLPMDSCIQGLKATPEGKSIDPNIQICIGKLAGGQDSCGGDSGGPVVCQRCTSCGWYLAGVTSFGQIECGNPGSGAIYVDVRKYEHWIRQRVPLVQDHFVC